MSFTASVGTSATLLMAVLSVMASDETHTLNRRPPEGLPRQKVRNILYVILHSLPRARYSPGAQAKSALWTWSSVCVRREKAESKPPPEGSERKPMVSKA